MTKKATKKAAPDAEPDEPRAKSPYEQGYSVFGLWSSREISIEDVRRRLPEGIELWDESDGTPAVSVIPVSADAGGGWRVRVVAKGPRKAISLAVQETVHDAG